MQELLVGSVLVIAGVFVGMTALIVVNKAWRESVQHYRQARRHALEPAVLRFAAGPATSLTAALGGELRPGDRPVIEEVLLDHVQRVRGSARDRLTGALDQLGFVERYLDVLSSRRWWRRAWAAEKLGLARAGRAVDPLIRAMEDESPDVRMRVVRALGEIGGPTSVRELIRTLNQPSRWSSIRIADVLTGLGKDAVQQLTAEFDELGRTGKLAALDVVGRVRPLHAVPWLVERLEDPDEDVRARACHALGSIGDPQAASALGRALTDEAWPVRAMAAKALGRVGRDEAVPLLRDALGDREWWVRANAARALRTMGPPGIRALEEALGSADRFARHQAVLMLEETGAVDRAAHQLVSDSEVDRERARAFLQRFVAAGRVGRLRSLADGASEPALRLALAALLPKTTTAPEGEA